MLREVADALEVLTAEQPLVLTFEDLHWSDPSTIDLISLLARRRERARLLIIGTYRPVDIAGNGRPLRAIVQELVAHQLCSELRVGPLNRAAIEEYLANRFRHGARNAEPSAVLLQELTRAIHQRTEGNPLFMVNAVDYLLTQGAVIRSDGQWDLHHAATLVQTAVPPNVQQLIERQIDQVSLVDQRVIEVASVAGVEFSAAAVASGLEITTREVEERCVELVRRSLFLAPGGSTEWPDGTIATRYGFQHALYQQVLYERIPTARCIELHQRIGERTERAYGTQTREAATALAFHFERGHKEEKAVQYLHQAGENAIRRMAYTEAHALLSHGLRLLERVPRSPQHLRQEALLYQALITPLLILKGYAAPEVAHVCTRARDLWQQLGETPQLSLVWGGLYSFYFNRAEINTACEFARRYVHVAQTRGAEEDVVWAQMSLGHVLFHAGEFSAARLHLRHGLSVYDSLNHSLYASDFVQDPGVHGRSVLACTLWWLGYTDQALQHAQAALAVAQQLAHPPSLAFATGFLAVIHIWRQEWSAFDQTATALTQLAREHDLRHWRATATVLRGWRLALQGQTKDAIMHMRQGMTSLQEMGTRLGLPGYLFMLAGTHALGGMLAEALALLDEALTIAQQTGERYNEAGLYVLKGELTRQKLSVASSQVSVLSAQALAPSTELEAEESFLRALTIAQQQQAKSLELRAVMSLVRLRQQQATPDVPRNAHHATRATQHEAHDKLAEAHSMLSEVYNWFTEGFDTADVREARALLEALGH
jgi:predicted ATPase